MRLPTLSTLLSRLASPAAGVLAATALSVSAVAQTTVLSNFEAGVGGWTVNDPVQTGITWHATGGNPGGFLHTYDLNPGSAAVMAPPQFLFPLLDWSSLGPGGYIQFDYCFIRDPDHHPLSSSAQISLQGPGGKASYAWPGLAPTSWETFQVPLDPSVWNVVQGTWFGLMANVAEVRVSVEDTTGHDEHGIDNFLVTSSDCNGNGINDVLDIASGYSFDIQGNHVPDECEPDCNANGMPDDYDITSGSSFDCDQNWVPDECDPDCNGNGVPDLCDVATGFSPDINGDGYPDECSPDCNQNGFPDSWDIAQGASWDRDGDGVPDECEPDCNGNLYPDDHDIATGTSQDVDFNGVPDECEPDCNGNLVPDAYDILTGLSMDVCGDGIPDECEPDCNGNGTPDDFDISTGFSMDVCLDGIPDECEDDCDMSLVPDHWEIELGLHQDCQGNGIPDDCDILVFATSLDCDYDMVPDECEPDCNWNGTPDDCEVLAGTAQDCNGNWVPDECEVDCNGNRIPDECDISSGTSSDLNFDGVPDECVLSAFRFCMTDLDTEGQCPCGNDPAILSKEGCVNETGRGAFLSAIGVPSVAADTVQLVVRGAPPHNFGIYGQNLGGGYPLPFWNGLFCLAANGQLVRHYAPPVILPTQTDANGTGTNAQALTLGDFFGFTQPGVTLYYQYWYRDPAGPCGFGVNFSSGIALTWEP